ncbi:MAG: hypothetical protein AB4368_17135 [Xenococcaceae cyanobacterium]
MKLKEIRQQGYKALIDALGVSCCAFKLGISNFLLPSAFCLLPFSTTKFKSVTA